MIADIITMTIMTTGKKATVRLLTTRSGTLAQSGCAESRALQLAVTARTPSAQTTGKRIELASVSRNLTTNDPSLCADWMGSTLALGLKALSMNWTCEVFTKVFLWPHTEAVPHELWNSRDDSVLVLCTRPTDLRAVGRLRQRTLEIVIWTLPFRRRLSLRVPGVSGKRRGLKTFKSMMD